MSDPANEFRKVPLETLTSLVQSVQRGFYRFNDSVGVKVHFLKRETSLSYSIPYGVVISVIGVVGNVRGGLSVILAQDGFDKYVSALTGGIIPPDLGNEIAMSCIGEMLNMVAGRMALEMSQCGYSIDITPPQTFCGDKIRQVESGDTAHIILPYSFDGSSCGIHLVINSRSV
ncbi:MAG: hypothetical protein EOM02_01535 [Synergistales bacterium]|nr:hypothetical protein [Synergistales bacterium]